jgi:hypothetical protein
MMEHLQHIFASLGCICEHCLVNKKVDGKQRLAICIEWCCRAPDDEYWLDQARQWKIGRLVDQTK